MTFARTLVALATYNEIENLPALVDEILRTLPDATVLVVDDKSPDGTGRWCDERAASESRLKCIHREGKLGLGSATIAAMRFAMAGDFDAIVTMDADWSHDPAHLPQLIGALEFADVAIGSRYCAGGAIKGWPIHRRIASRCINRLSRLILKLPVQDASGAFRAYRIAKLQAICLDDIQASGYAYLEEILWLLAQTDATFAELPITFSERRAGSSKISLREAGGKLKTLRRLAGSADRKTRPNG